MLGDAFVPGMDRDPLQTEVDLVARVVVGEHTPWPDVDIQVANGEPAFPRPQPHPYGAGT